jgi:hypothetical protein
MSRPPDTRTTEEGSALIAVLVVLLVVSVGVGLILLIQALQHRFVRRDVYRLQARYAAEAGVYRALADLDRPRPLRTGYALRGVDQCSVRVEPFGGFVRVRVRARVHGEEVVLGALAGRRPPEAFEGAVLVGDEGAGLTLAGTTRIQGTVVVGRDGVVTRRLAGTPFTGRLDGPVQRRRDRALPAYDSTTYRRVARSADRLLRALPPGTYTPTPTDRRARAPEDAVSPGHDPRSDSTVVVPETVLPATDRLVRVVEGDVTISEADSTLLAHRVLIAATEDLSLTGALDVVPGSLFLAGRTLTVTGRLAGGDGLFYGRDSSVVRGGRATGQFLSRHVAVVRGDAHLSYPSVVSVSDSSGVIRVKGRAQVDGLVLFPFRASRKSGVRRRVLVGPEARVRGGVYSRAQTELAGSVEGSVLTHQFGFYRSPTHYVNWLNGATIRRGERPSPFVVPYGFDHGGRAQVVRWAEVEAPRS